MRKYISLTAFIFAFSAVFFGSNSAELTQAVEQTTNPELIKFIAPIVAGLIGKFFDYLLKRRAIRKGEK